MFIVRIIGAENAEFLSNTVGGKQFPLSARELLWYTGHALGNKYYVLRNNTSSG